MSTHYSKARIFTKCHATEILHNASKGAISADPSKHGSIVASIPNIQAEPISYEVIYNKRMSKFMGREVPSCTKTVIEAMKIGDKYVYEVIQVEDYGDEGCVDVVGYLVCDYDLVLKYRKYFDEIRRIY